MRSLPSRGSFTRRLLGSSRPSSLKFGSGIICVRGMNDNAPIVDHHASMGPAYTLYYDGLCGLCPPSYLHIHTPWWSSKGSSTLELQSALSTLLQRRRREQLVAMCKLHQVQHPSRCTQVVVALVRSQCPFCHIDPNTVSHNSLWCSRKRIHGRNQPACIRFTTRNRSW